MKAPREASTKSERPKVPTAAEAERRWLEGMQRYLDRRRPLPAMKALPPAPRPERAPRSREPE